MPPGDLALKEILIMWGLGVLLQISNMNTQSCNHVDEILGEKVELLIRLLVSVWIVLMSCKVWVKFGHYTVQGNLWVIVVYLWFVFVL